MRAVTPSSGEGTCGERSRVRVSCSATASQGKLPVASGTPDAHVRYGLHLLRRGDEASAHVSGINVLASQPSRLSAVC